MGPNVALEGFALFPRALGLPSCSCGPVCATEALGLSCCLQAGGCCRCVLSSR